jgi:hypothetical protein
VGETPEIPAATAEGDRFRDYVERLAKEFDCPPSEALEKLIEIAGVDADIAATLRAACVQLVWTESAAGVSRNDRRRPAQSGSGSASPGRLGISVVRD